VTENVGISHWHVARVVVMSYGPCFARLGPLLPPLPPLYATQCDADIPLQHENLTKDLFSTQIPLKITNHSGLSLSCPRNITMSSVALQPSYNTHFPGVITCPFSV